jgi:hypothetical protein
VSGDAGASPRSCLEARVVPGLSVCVRTTRIAVSASVVIAKVEETAAWSGAHLGETELAGVDRLDHAKRDVGQEAVNARRRGVVDDFELAVCGERQLTTSDRQTSSFVDRFHIGCVVAPGSGEQSTQCVTQHSEPCCVFDPNALGASQFGCAGSLSKPGIDPGGMVEHVEAHWSVDVERVRELGDQRFAKYRQFRNPSAHSNLLCYGYYDS